jgi:hypothetical protein
LRKDKRSQEKRKQDKGGPQVLRRTLFPHPKHVSSSFVNPFEGPQDESIVALWYESLTALEWLHIGIHLNLRMKVAEIPHRTSLHRQKDLHHNSHGMTENHPKNIATGHPRIGGTNL